MPSTKKLTPYRNKQFSGPTPAKPAVRALNRAVRERVEREHNLIQSLIRDADDRRELLISTKRPFQPFSVWTDFDPDIHTAEHRPSELSEWKHIGEFLKFHLLFQVALMDGGYSFTVRVRPDLQAKWAAEGRNPMERIRRETRKALETQGLEDVAYCYVVEGKTKRGAQTSLHLHGFLLAADPLVATRFQVAMEKAIAAHGNGRAAAGIAKHSGPAVQVKRSYDKIDNSKYGRGRWAGYLAKNACKWDNRLPGRRLFMSREATKTAEAFWGLLRTEPFE